MKALIHGSKVIQIEPKSFPVHKSMEWIDCDASVSVGDDYDGGAFSAPPAIAKTKIETDAEHRTYLNSTDWYVVRKFERGVEIPVDVAQKRTDSIEALNA